MSDWYVYIIGKKGKLYAGITTDLPNRMRQHGVAKPLYREGPLAKSEALKRERTLKDWRKEKEKEMALIDKFSSPHNGELALSLPKGKNILSG